MEPRTEPKPAGFFERAGALGIEVALWISVSGGITMAWGMVVAPFGGSVSAPFYPWSMVSEALVVGVALAWAYHSRRSPGMVAIGLNLESVRRPGRPGIAASLVRALFAVVAGGTAFLFGAALLATGFQEGPEYEANWTNPFLLGTGLAFAAILASYLPMAVTKRRRSLVIS